MKKKRLKQQFPLWELKKLFCIMKLVFFFLLLSSNLVWAAQTYAQVTSLNLELNNVNLEEVFEAIRQQSEFEFFYNNDQVNTLVKVSVEAKEADIEAVLEQVLPVIYEYRIKDRYILINMRQEEVSSQSARVQTEVQQHKKTISGKIVDEQGEPVIGANIMEQGTTNGTITDFDGNFSLSVEEDAILHISYIGYLSQEINTMGQNVLNIILLEDTQSLDELIVVGYGSIRKGNVATSVTSIDSEILQNRPVQTVGEAIQGLVPGLSVLSSGKPGTTPTITLRGATSLNGVGTPIVLVDGVPSDFNYLNTEDIQSINVLKDAASASIYGSRAANGVILVTTKRGETGKPTVRYNGSIGINSPTSLPESVSSATYARVINEAETNMNKASIWSEKEIILFESGTDPNNYPNTNWLKHGIQNSFTTSHNIETSGGTENVKYLVSGGFNHQTGVLPENYQNVFNIRSSTDITVSNKMNISYDLRYQMRKLDELPNLTDNYKQLLAANPTQVAYYTDSSYGYNAGFFINPLVDIFEGGHKYYDKHDASGIFKFNFDITNDLKFIGLANVNYIFGNTSQHNKSLYYNDIVTGQESVKGENGLTERRDYSFYLNIQAMLNYVKSIDNHNFDLLLGYQQENEKSKWISAERTGYPTDLVWVLNAGPQSNWNNSGNAEHWAIASVIGRLNYDYNNKYILSASFRSDASSRFTKDNRWSIFPSLAGAWRISQEPFMESTASYLDDFKIRASIGQTGAATGLGLYPSYTTITMDGIVLDGSWIQTARLNRIGNPELTWERTEMLNFGFDIQSLKNRLSFSGDYYIKTTNDILIGLPVPLEYGFGNPSVNIGKMRNKGWEFVLKWRDKVNDFHYGVSVNLSDNNNKVLDLAGTGPWKDGYTDEGLPFRSFYGYESMGLFQSESEVEGAPFQNSKTSAGDVRYVDQNGDNKIDADDRVVLGDPYPHYLFGVDFDASYKGFDLYMLFQGIGEKDFILRDQAVRPLNDTPIFEHQMDYWSELNRSAKYPRILNKDDGSHNYEMSDFWKINAGYLRMKNLQIGYTFPEKILNPKLFSRVRVYFSANNLFTVSNFIPGWDPEIGNSLTYPFSKTYSMGINIQF